MLQDNAITGLADLMGWMFYHITHFLFNLSPGLLMIYATFMLAAYIGVVFLIVRRKIHESY